MKAKYKKGEQVFCKEQRRVGIVEKILRFINEDNLTLYKVNVDNQFITFFEEQLDHHDPTSFIRQN